MTGTESERFQFVENMGLLFERSGASRTLGRVFGYLLLSGEPKTLDEIAEGLLFSKATASLTVRQGLFLHFFEKISIPGERKDHYQANAGFWIGSMSQKIDSLKEWEELVEKGLGLIDPRNKAALENLQEMKDYFNFLRWYFSDLDDQYRRWKNGEIPKGD